MGGHRFVPAAAAIVAPRRPPSEAPRRLRYDGDCRLLLESERPGRRARSGQPAGQPLRLAAAPAGCRHSSATICRRDPAASSGRSITPRPGRQISLARNPSWRARERGQESELSGLAAPLVGQQAAAALHFH